MSVTQIISSIFTQFTTYGHQSYGEEVTALQHALQCAYLAQRAGESSHLIAACLLHDYGHLLHTLGEDIASLGVDAGHEVLGADYLAQFFAAEIVEPIRLHVEAKRYWCWQHPQYFVELSPASQHSLSLQGGVMTTVEASAFKRSRYSDAAIWLRGYDDAAKALDLPVPPLEQYRPMLAALVRR